VRTKDAGSAPARLASPVDYDLHGYVGIRLLDAHPADVAVVDRQLGPIRASLNREPDVTVRFVDRIETGPLSYVSYPECGFTAHAFYLLRGKANTPGRVRIPFERVGQGVTIDCERGLPAVPLLLALVNFAALSKGLLPLHASAFVHEGRGVLATGWSKGGKTELLLSFASGGARYVGDEWVFVSAARELFGLPEPIRLWRWQLRQLPDVAARLTAQERLRIETLHAAAELVQRAAARRSPMQSVLRRAEPVLRRQVYVQLPPSRIFGPAGMVPQARLDHVVLVISHDVSDTHVAKVPAAEIGRRTLASLEEERAPFMAAYRQFRYAFPDRSSPVVDGASETEQKLVGDVFNGIDAWSLHHPYPVYIPSLRPALIGALSGT
jgi:hypothetical protein